MQTFQHAAVDLRAQQSPWDRYFSLLAAGFCPNCRAPNAHQSMSQEITQWRVVVECERCRWSIGGFARADDVLISEGLARARKSQRVDQALLTRWLRSEQGSVLLESRRQSLVDALLADAGHMDGFLAVKLLPQRGKMTWDLAAKVLDPDSLTALRERWQPRVNRTAVVTDLTRQPAKTTSGMNCGAKPTGTNVILQSALFEFLVLRARHQLFRCRQSRLVHLLTSGVEVEPGPLSVTVQQQESAELFPPKLVKVAGVDVAAAIRSAAPDVERHHIFLTTGKGVSTKPRAFLTV